MGTQAKPLAIVTAASTGIGLELARQCATNGFDLIIAAHEPAIHDVASELRTSGAWVESMEAVLATIEGVDRLCHAIGVATENASAGVAPIDQSGGFPLYNRLFLDLFGLAPDADSPRRFPT